MSKFFDSLVKKAGNELATKATDGLLTDVVSWIDTGSYSLNALLSGSIYKGLPDNKIVALAGEESTGKTFYALSIAKHFLDTNKDGAVFYFESEGAVTTDMLKQRAIDTDRFYVIPVATIQEFRTQIIKIIDEYALEPKATRKPIFTILDSLGNLSTNKEVGDMSEGKDTRDMTRTQLIRGAFRVMTLKLSHANVPLLVINHTYEVVGAYVPTKEMCLVAGTPVWVGHTGVFPVTSYIEDLMVGSIVQTLNGPAPIEKVHSFETKVYKLTFDDGSVIECSGEHKFLVDGEWLSVLDLLAAAENTKDINREVAHISGDLDVYRQQILENLPETD